MKLKRFGGGVQGQGRGQEWEQTREHGSKHCNYPMVIDPLERGI